MEIISLVSAHSLRRIAANDALIMGQTVLLMLRNTVFPWAELEKSYRHEQIMKMAIAAGHHALDALEPEQMKNGRNRAIWRDEIDFDWDGIPCDDVWLEGLR
jgi:hypothetical protein